MIKMQEVVDLLTDCELGNLVYVDPDSKEINMTKLPALVRSINLIVLDLHKRFSLKIGTIVIDTIPGQTRYYLRNTYQMNNGKPKPDLIQYIREGNDKLNPRSILKVEQVFHNDGRELLLNKQGEQFGVMTPAIDILEVNPYALSETVMTSLTVNYRMAPKKEVVCPDNLDNWYCLDVDIPYTHLQALIWGVASRSHSSIGFADNTTSEFNNYTIKYENECGALDVLNLRVDQQGENDQFARNGWA